MKFRACLLLALILLLLPVTARAWYEKTHAWLLDQAVELVKKMDQDQRLYAELYAGAFRVQMGRGAWREDYDPPVANISRAMRHYYDPTIVGPIKGVPYYDYFVFWPILDRNEKVARPAGQRYDGAERWALDGGGLADNPFNWVRAISAYGHGSLAAREEAYFRLGHVLHLLADMSEVDHATNTVHPASGRSLRVNVEESVVNMAVMMFEASLKWNTFGFVDEATIRSYLKPENKKRLIDAFQGPLSDILRKFHLPGSVRLTGFEGLAEDAIPPEAVKDFFPIPESNGLVAALAGLPAPSSEATKIPDCSKFPAFFNELAAMVRRDLPGTMRLAVGCADLAPLLTTAVAVLFPKPSIIGTIFTNKFLSSPIYAIPIINELEANSFGSYLPYRDAMLREAVAYLAGLMMHFQDVVKEPPFVQEVTVRQTNGREYSASWGEGQKDVVDLGTGRTIELYGEISTPRSSIPKYYRAIMGRTLAHGSGRPLQAGRMATVTIGFGPVLQAHGEEIKPRINPQSVKVRIDGKPVDGRMKDANTWSGSYTPEISGDMPEKPVKMEIEARDLHKHFLPMSPDGKGYWLDSDPTTVAQLSATAPNFDAADSNTKPPAYEWKFYEDGPKHDHVDRNHAFAISREEVEEPARGEHLSIAPGKTVVSLSGRLDAIDLEEARDNNQGDLLAEAPSIHYLLMSDGTATIAPERMEKFEVTLAHRPGKAGGWKEVWTAQPEPGKGSVRRAAGPCQISSARYRWTESGGAVTMTTSRAEPRKVEWSVLYDTAGAFVLYPGSGWGPPRFRLNKEAEPDTPEVLVAQYLAWFDEGKGEAFNHDALEAVERGLNARELNPLTAVASLCAARKEIFLRDNPTPGDKEFSFRVTSLALYHLKNDGQAHFNHGEYILQAIAASKMNKWGDKTFIPNWLEAALEKAVMAAPGFFPDTGDKDGFAGGIDLLSTGQSKIAQLKAKHKNNPPKILFEGWGQGRD
jgi:hypothetical protein